MRWRSVKGEAGGFASWVRALAGKCGAYVVRERQWVPFATGPGRVLYVGESHTGKLYGTLTRHFQSWHCDTAGARYAAGDVEVAVAVTRDADGAAFLQQRLIDRLDPRDNKYLKGEGEPAADDPAPF
jgi:excinuclease UvrABC nuclease subunit